MSEWDRIHRDSESELGWHTCEPEDLPPLKQGLAFRKGVSAKALMAKQFAPISWIVPGYLVEGMTFFAGAPKLGKSWMVLGWALAVAGGTDAMGSIPCEQGDVLGLMLEDNQRRLQRRISQLRIADLPERLTLLTEWPTLDDGCIDEIEAWIESVEKPQPGHRRGAKPPVIALFSRCHPNPGDCGKRPKRSLNAFCL